MELQVAVFPLASVKVRVTAFEPTFTQVNVVGLAVLEMIAQLSVEALSICSAVMFAVPMALSCTETFWQIAFGRMVSRTVTVPAQVDEFPL